MAKTVHNTRSLSYLHPLVRTLVEEWLSRCKTAGLDVIVVCTFRSLDCQKALYAQGRYSLGVVNDMRKIVGLYEIAEEENYKVTWTLDTMHFFGVAVDFAIVQNGRATWNLKADINEDGLADYEQAGKIAEDLGFQWGITDKKGNHKDQGHIQYTAGLTLKELKEGKRPGGKA